MPLDSASLLACGVITGLGAVVNTAAVPCGSSVVVLGTGGVGLNSVQGAVLCGAEPIVAVDAAPAKLEAAKSFGATLVDPGRDDLATKVRALTGGRDRAG
jgi:S-(hydroxymethyl)glutathione dehydrogenase / alcohol dehydrogenase